MISPPGAYHNDKCVMINPPGRTTMGGLMKTLHRLQQSCSQGNIFTPVCHSVHRGGVSEADLPPGAVTPRDQTPLGADTPQEQTPPWEQTPPHNFFLKFFLKIFLKNIFF